MASSRAAPKSRRFHARSIVYQLLAVGGFVWLVYFLATNTAENLAIRGMQTGFDFLYLTAGFEVNFKLIDYRLGVDTYGRIFLLGVVNTLFISVCVIAASTVMAVIVGIARLSPNWLTARLALIYVEFIRNTPVLIHLVFWHTALLHGLPHVRESVDLAGLGIAFLNNRGLHVPSPVAGPLFSATLAAIPAALILVVIGRRWMLRRQDLTGATLPVFSISCGLLIGLPMAIHMATGAPLSWEVPSLQRFNYEGGVQLPISFVSILISLSI